MKTVLIKTIRVKCRNCKKELQIPFIVIEQLRVAREFMEHYSPFDFIQLNPLILFKNILNDNNACCNKCDLIYKK